MRRHESTDHRCSHPKILRDIASPAVIRIRLGFGLMLRSFLPYAACLSKRFTSGLYLLLVDLNLAVTMQPALIVFLNGQNELDRAIKSIEQLAVDPLLKPGDGVGLGPRFGFHVVPEA